jgi:YHS domain-containing protein
VGAFSWHRVCIEAWCKESFSPRHTFESAVYDEGVYFFCSKKCMDMWMSVNAQEIELEDQQQPSK